jgi:hypothetical protein
MARRTQGVASTHRLMRSGSASSASPPVNSAPSAKVIEVNAATSPTSAPDKPFSE